MTAQPITITRPAHPATPSGAYATPANQCEYAGHAWDSLTDSLTITSLTPACPAARLTARLTPYGDDGMLAWEATLAAYCDDGRVVTGDDGLDHYL